MTARMVLFGYGNPSRGDDALGPLLLARAEDWLAGHPHLPIQTVGDFQLQIEHVMDLEACDLAVFLDADVACAPPFQFSRVVPDQDATFSTHELSPAAVLHVCREVSGTPPPTAYALRIRGESFDLGRTLSPQASRNLEAAWSFLQPLLQEGCPALFEARVS